MAPTVWTPRRKWMGNILPALVWLPLSLAGLLIAAKSGDFLGPGLWLLVAASVFGWLLLNQFGLFENERMKPQLVRILLAKGELLPEPHWFVGFATPRFSSALDAHEDVGFLFLLPDRATFLSETRKVEVMRCDIKEFRFRANVHSLVGLGRWVSIEGQVGEKPIRFTVEPRVHRTLFANRRASADLLVELEKWRK